MLLVVGVFICCSPFCAWLFVCLFFFLGSFFFIQSSFVWRITVIFRVSFLGAVCTSVYTWSIARGTAQNVSVGGKNQKIGRLKENAQSPANAIHTTNETQNGQNDKKKTNKQKWSANTHARTHTEWFECKMNWNYGFSCLFFARAWPNNFFFFQIVHNNKTESEKSLCARCLFVLFCLLVRCVRYGASLTILGCVTHWQLLLAPYKQQQEQQQNGIYGPHIHIKRENDALYRNRRDRNTNLFGFIHQHDFDVAVVGLCSYLS